MSSAVFSKTSRCLFINYCCKHIICCICFASHIKANIVLYIVFDVLLPCLHSLGMLKVPIHSGSVDVRLPCTYDHSGSPSSDGSSCNLYMRLVHSQYNSIASNFVVDYATQHLYTGYRPSARFSLVQEERAIQMLAVATRCIQFIVQVKRTRTYFVLYDSMLLLAPDMFVQQLLL
jgi:hypothetical protein